MNLRVSGGGKKEEALRRLLIGKGHTVREERPDVWVMPLPFSDAEDAEITALETGTHLVAGRVRDALEARAAERGLTLHRIDLDEEYLTENSRLSAEGAVYAAMGDTDGAVYGAECLIVGNGHLAMALGELLEGMGARPRIAARRQTGQEVMPLSALDDAIASFDFVFNTVPFPVLTARTLSRAKKETLFMELASAPYGIDRAAAEALGLRYRLESCIPGRYCPHAAARAIMGYLERSVFGNE